jgi:hypothetical protein
VRPSNRERHPDWAAAVAFMAEVPDWAQAAEPATKRAAVTQRMIMGS